MKIRLLENIKKRIIVVIIGTIGYYTIPIPAGLLFHSFFRIETINSFWFYYAFQGITISFLVGFLYIAFVKVSPSLVPKTKRFRYMVMSGIVLIITISVLIPSGLIIKDWQLGQCIIKSGHMVDGKISAGTTSFGVYSEIECIKHCEFAGRFAPNDAKTCEFNAIFGLDRWEEAPDGRHNLDGRYTIIP